MQAIPISLQEYEAFLRTHTVRYFYNHAPAYAELKRREGNPVFPLVLRENGHTHGVALLIYYRYKRFLWRAECQFGPLLLDPTPTILAEAAVALRQYAFSQFRCRAFRLTPMQICTRAPHVSEENIPSLPRTPEEQAERARWINALNEAGFISEPTEWYNHRCALMRFCYSKPLPTHLAIEEAEHTFWAQVSPSLRTAIQKSLRDGISVRPLRREELPLLCDMLQATYNRKQTISTVIPERYESLWDCFGADLTYLMAYLDVPQVLKHLHEQKQNLEAEHHALQERYGKEPGTKKGRGALRDWQERYDPLLRQIQRIEDLRTQYGENIPLNITGYIRCGYEWIHFLGAGYADRQFLNGSSRLHQEAVRLAIQHGCRIYNLYACSGLPTQHNPVDAGVQKYKETFLGNYEELLGGFFSAKRFFALDRPGRPISHAPSPSCTKSDALSASDPSAHSETTNPPTP